MFRLKPCTLTWSGLRGAGIGDEFRRPRLVCELVARQVRQTQNLSHLRVVDPLGGVRRVVVIGMKAGEPPERRNIVQQEWKLVAAEENVQRIVPVEAVVQIEADIFV